MVTGTTLYGDISPRTAARAERRMLKNNSPYEVLGKLGTTLPQPKNATEAVKLRRAVAFAASTIPLQEGVTPSPDKFAVEDVLVTLKQYGRWTQLTDWIEDTHEDPVLQMITDELGKVGIATVEQIIFAAVRGGTGITYANGSARTDVNSVLSLAKQRSVTRTLKRNKARKITKMLSSTADYESTNLEPAFVAVGHSDLENDIRALAGFADTSTYRGALISEHEIGKVEDVRYVLTPDLSPFLDGGHATGAGTTRVSNGGAVCDVYPILFFGEEAFVQVPLRGAMSMTPIIVNPKPANGDPLGQRGSAAIKFATAAKITNESWMHRLEVACTLL